MRSWTSRPTGLSAKAVTTAVSRPKQRLSPRATLYSPPPSQTWKLRVVATRPSPGSSRSITSPRATRSKRQRSLLLTFSDDIGWPGTLPGSPLNSTLGRAGFDLHVAADLGGDLAVLRRTEADLGLDLQHHAGQRLDDLGVQ